MKKGLGVFLFFLVVFQAEAAKVPPASVCPVIDFVIDGVFRKHDRDRDARLSTTEALRFYPKIRKELARRTLIQNPEGRKGKQYLEGVFAYLLKFGHSPGGKLDTLDFFYWLQHGSWDFHADRERLSRVLSVVYGCKKR